MALLTFMLLKIIIGVDGNIQDIYFYTPKTVPVSAIGNTDYSSTNKPFWHNRYRFLLYLIFMWIYS